MRKSGGWRYILVMMLALGALAVMDPVVCATTAHAQSGVIRDIRVTGNTVRSVKR